MNYSELLLRSQTQVKIKNARLLTEVLKRICDSQKVLIGLLKAQAKRTHTNCLVLNQEHHLEFLQCMQALADCVQDGEIPQTKLGGLDSEWDGDKYAVTVVRVSE